MSDAPPGAVLMTNSTGWVGWTAAAVVATAAVLGAVVAPPPAPPQAVATMSPATASEIDRPTGFRIDATSRYFLRARARMGERAGQTRRIRGQTGGIVGRTVHVTPTRPKWAHPVPETGQVAELVRMVKELTRPATALPRGAAPETAWAFFNGDFVPLRDAKVSVLTHAFNYGTGVFEGVRAYWNAEQKQLYGLHLLEHYQRLHRSCKVHEARSALSARAPGRDHARAPAP